MNFKVAALAALTAPVLASSPVFAGSFGYTEEQHQNSTSSASNVLSVWRPDFSASGLTDIQRLAVFSDGSLAAAAQGGLYLIDRLSGQSHLLYSFPDSSTFIQDLTIFNGFIYAVTDTAVYRVARDGSGEKFFQPSEDEKPCRTAVEFNGVVFVGTERGWHMRRPGEPVWNKLQGPVSGRSVARLRVAGSFLYIVDPEKRFK